MTVSIEYIPVTSIEYPEEDGELMAEGDLQRKCLVYATTVLDIYFQNHPDVYVAGNLLIYYEEGQPQTSIAPDVFVVFGVKKHDRGTYKIWEEDNKSPNFVLEITSKTTRIKDQGAKKGIYSFLGVTEYFQYDPSGDYLKPQLQGLQLVNGSYSSIPSNKVSDDVLSVNSAVLGLELRLEAGKLRFYDPVNKQLLLTHEEEIIAKQKAEEKALKLAAKLRELNIDPDSL